MPPTSLLDRTSQAFPFYCLLVHSLFLRLHWPVIGALPSGSAVALNSNDVV